MFQSMNNNMIDKRDEFELKADLSNLSQSYVNSYRLSQEDTIACNIFNKH